MPYLYGAMTKHKSDNMALVARFTLDNTLVLKTKKEVLRKYLVYVFWDYQQKQKKFKPVLLCGHVTAKIKPITHSYM